MKTIKKTGFILGIIALTSFSSCNETVSKEEHDKQLAFLTESQHEMIASRDSLERLYITTLDEIDKNLDEIRNKKGVIILGPNSNTDQGISKKEQILNNIGMINSLLDDNKKKIARLERSLQSYKKGKTELISSINLAKERILQQEQEIDDLKKLLAENQFKIAELNDRLAVQVKLAEDLDQRNKQLDKELNKVYFVAGTYKELKEKKIVEKTGGLVGLGRVKTLSKQIDKQQLVELNQKENTSLVLQGSEPKLISSHPTNSYTLVPSGPDMVTLTIHNPDSFWSNSRYLVVETH